MATIELFSLVLGCVVISACGGDSRDESGETPIAGPNASGGGGGNGSEGESGSGDGDGDGDGDGVPSVIFDLGEGEGGGGGDGNGSDDCENIDFLFVIDNSSSMGDEQAGLIASVPQFVDSIKNSLDLESYNVGIVTSDVYEGNSAPCNQIGGLVTSTAGNESSNSTCGPFATGKNYMSNADDLTAGFVCAGKVGISGDGNERPMEAMMSAITPDLGVAGACNEGFLRDDALLVVVIITDEEDNPKQTRILEGSPGDPPDWHEAVLVAKNGYQENSVVLSLIGIGKPNECPSDQWDGYEGAEISARIRHFTELFEDHGFLGDVCASSYGAFFEEALTVVESACDDFVPVG